VQGPSIGIVGKILRAAIGTGELDPDRALADETQQCLEAPIGDADARIETAHMVDDHWHRRGDLAENRRKLGQDAPIAPDLHVPAELAHGRAEDLEHVEPNAAHIIRPMRRVKDVETQTAYAEPVPAT
jgi:hypothetical protein